DRKQDIPISHLGTQIACTISMAQGVWRDFDRDQRGLRLRLATSNETLHIAVSAMVKLVDFTVPRYFSVLEDGHTRGDFSDAGQVVGDGSVVAWSSREVLTTKSSTTAAMIGSSPSVGPSSRSE